MNVQSDGEGEGEGATITQKSIVRTVTTVRMRA